MTRQTAYTILTKYVTNQTLLQHSLATEAVMRSLALQFGRDPEEWGIAGLLHDADYEKAKGHPEQHGLLLSKLEPNTVPSTIEHAIQAHNFEFTKVLPASRMDWALTCCDELTGIIMELTEKTTDKKLKSLTPTFVMEKLQGSLAKKEYTKTIFLSEEKLGMPLQEFVTLTLSAMQNIAPQIGQ